ncbi:MAG: hypothetical protein NW200_11880 [Hyphomonadaceae bacterium]|nr:hypothetical protein [Hyphomonadaceae bacterium]
MAAILVSGFVVQLATGRSSFSAPLIVHAHAVLFMGWVAIVLTQTWLAAAGTVSVHRMIGRLALVYSLAMLVSGVLVTSAAVQTGRVPFFFQPQHFLVADPVSLVAFLALLGGAVLMRKRTDWHARLQIGAFAALMGPGVGRLLPMPLLAPWAFETAVLVGLFGPLAGIVRDMRASGRVHPAWLWAIGVVVGALVLARVIAFTPIGDGLYSATTAGGPMAGTDGRAFPLPPGPPPGP